MTNLSITEAAAERIRALGAEHPDATGVRIGTKTMGCNGLAYTVDFVTEPQAGDIALKDRGVTLYVDTPSLPYIEGMVMDFEDSMFTTGFTFSNPNAKGTCGCGESFNV